MHIRKILLIGLLLCELTICGCSTDVDIKHSSNNIGDDGETSDKYPLQDEYVDIDKLTFAKNVSMNEVIEWCENHKNDIEYPRVRKYIHNNLGQYDEEWFVMENYKVSYCYKYYDGRNYSNGNLFYMKEIYILPEINKFEVKYKQYTYNQINLNNLQIFTTYEYSAFFNFNTKENAKDVAFGGNYSHQGVIYPKMDITNWANIIFLFNFNCLIPPCNLPYSKDSSFNYAYGDLSKDVEFDKATLNEIALELYWYLNKCLNFTNEFLNLVNSSFQLVSL